MFDILAILGRGIQMLDPESDPTKVESYVLTEDLEVCDERSAHLPVRVPANDSNPYCMIGGGEINLLAGSVLMDYNPEVIVCAYGDRSDYLKSVDGPTESEVMSQILLDPVPDAAVEVWPRERSLEPPSGTYRELRNIFDLALERELRRIAIVTVGVHVPRTATYVAKFLSVFGQYRGLSPVVFESEEILLSVSQKEWRDCVEALRNSQAFARNWAREAIGISKIVRDVYGDAKPKVETN